MPITTNEVQVTWSSSASQSISAGGNATSDAMALSDAAFAREVFIKAKNNGTPASGDIITVYVLGTGGDPDGSSTNEYNTKVHAVSMELDTNLEDPVIRSFIVPSSWIELKVRCENGASSNGITVSALVMEKLA